MANILCAILLSMVMQLTVQSKSSVEQSGDVVGTARYACTYQKGQVRKGDTATLVLSELGYLRITQVKLSMKSNKSSGSGVLRMWCGDKLVSELNGTFADWTGSYSSNYVDVELSSEEIMLNTQNQDIRIELVGTENSLYIERYEVAYETAEQPAFEVRLHRADCAEVQVLREAQGGAGVLLPAADDCGDMFWSGWADSRIDSTSSAPQMWLAETMFYPVENTDLWATYCSVQKQENPYLAAVDYRSGYYALVLRSTLENGEALAMCGAPASGFVPGRYVPVLTTGELASLATDPTSEMLYYLDFDSKDSLLWITHVQTGQFLGPENGKIVAADHAWNYTISSDSTLVLYAMHDGYASLLGLSETPTGDIQFGLRGNVELQALSKAREKLWCMDADWLMADIFWTTDPLRTAVENPTLDKAEKEWNIRFGVYYIHISGKKKTICLCN